MKAFCHQLGTSELTIPASPKDPPTLSFHTHTKSFLMLAYTCLAFFPSIFCLGFKQNSQVDFYLPSAQIPTIIKPPAGRKTHGTSHFAQHGDHFRKLTTDFLPG